MNNFKFEICNELEVLYAKKEDIYNSSCDVCKLSVCWECEEHDLLMEVEERIEILEEMLND
ncbi:MAG: hypothetical protein ACRCZ0_08525 [Cetobacterium sp.]